MMLRAKAIRAVVMCVVACFALTAVAQTPVRMSWQTFAKDPKRVESFRRAVAAMKTADLLDHTGAGYRSAWSYWGNMHGYFGPQSRFGTTMGWINRRQVDVGVYGLYFYGVNDIVPPDAIAKDVWSQCQHGTPYFFAWHRLYLLYFEKTLQKAAKDPTLRLPYWDYTDPANVAMPAEFSTPTYTNAAGEVVPNPLYEVRRAPGWFGSPAGTLDPAVTNINDDLKIASLLDTKDAAGNVVPGYQSTIEQSPHGDVHCAVMDCPVPVMGAVPYSSNDAIFWLHHCNIDRLWDCWRSVPGHVNPTDDAYLKQPFSYVDENGQEVTKTVRDIISGNMVDYVYERPSDCARPELLYAQSAKMTPKEVSTTRKLLAKPVVLGTATGVAINAPTTKASIALPADKAPNAPTRDIALRSQQTVPVETDLVLTGIHYEAHPGAIFKVYLERKDDPTRRAFVGTLSFFMPLDAEMHEGHNMPAVMERVLDATAALRSIGGGGMQEVNVVFEASTGRLSAEQPHFNTASKLVIDSIALRVKLRPEPSPTP
jgi:hypothetical protein